VSTDELQARYVAAQARLDQRFAAAAAALDGDVATEAAQVAERFAISGRKRAPEEYAELATMLLTTYEPELAYLVAAAINDRYEKRLGYPPIGQIMRAIEEMGGERASRWICCALLNFPRVETARTAFTVIRSGRMRELVGARLSEEDPDLAAFIVTSNVPPARAPVRTMPRPLTAAEQRGDRLHFHLQVVAFVVLFLVPILGGLWFGWAGAAAGLVAGVLLRLWIRRSLGLRGPNLHDAFLIRMRERANGSRRRLLEALIERVRGRPFTRAQCAAIADAWDDARARLAEAASGDERLAIVEELDARVKRISYGEEV
jgi:hypothetical protein